jgi:hypothetical protein
MKIGSGSKTKPIKKPAEGGGENRCSAFSELRDVKARATVHFIYYSVRKFIFQQLCLHSVHSSFTLTLLLFFSPAPSYALLISMHFLPDVI